MARIRTIKPEFPQSESMGRVSRDARLLFIMLWTIADDAGRCRAAPRMLASLLFPYDDDATLRIPEWLMELEREKCVKVYAIDGNSYLQIIKWVAHQKIDHASPSRIPPIPSTRKPRERSRKSREEPTKPPEDFAGTSESFAPYLGPRKGPRTKDQGKDLGPGKETCAEPSALAPVDPVVIEIPTNRKDENFLVHQSLFDEYAKDYPAVDLDQEFRAMRGWAVSNPTKRKTASGMLRFCNSWLSKAQNRSGGNGQPRKEGEHEKLARVSAALIEEGRNGRGNHRDRERPEFELPEAGDDRGPIDGVVKNILPRFSGSH